MAPSETSLSGQEFFGDPDDRIGHNRLWFNLIRAHRKFYPILTAELKKHGINDPIWIEILQAIEVAGKSGKPMSALEHQLFMPQYALSRQISRLEQAGFIRREYVADGRRKQVLFLTEQGKGVSARIWPEYHKVIQDLLPPLISKDDAYELAKLLIKLLPRDD